MKRWAAAVSATVMLVALGYWLHGDSVAAGTVEHRYEMYSGQVALERGKIQPVLVRLDKATGAAKILRFDYQKMCYGYDDVDDGTGFLTRSPQ